MADEDKDRDDLEEEGDEELDSEDEAEDDSDDEDEAEDDSEDEDEAEDEDDSEDEAEDDSEDEDEDEAEDDSEDEAGDDPEDDDGEIGERAGAVAKALGLDDDDADDEKAAGDAPTNRAERRRQRAKRRRAGRNEQSAVAEEDTPGAGDRNKRKRAALLKRRRRAAEASDEELPADRLLPSEMVDDALARGSASAVQWVRSNWAVLQWVIIATVVGGGALLFWTYRSGEQSATAADILAGAVRAEEGTIIAKDADDRDEDQKKADVRRVFATEKERDDAALKAYQDLGAQHGDSGAAILAKLGEAGVMLDKREWDKAISAFSAVLESQLATADKDVKVRALEGRGFAEEGKGELDAALKTFVQIGEVPGDGFKALSKYHQARVLVARKDKKTATELLKEARKDVEKATLEGLKVAGNSPHRWLARAIDDELKTLDPSAVPVKPGGGMLPEQLRQKLQEQGLTPPPGFGQ